VNLSKRFDDWDEVVECNNCAHYWDDTCDGVSKDKTKKCVSYKATRSVVIPQQIKSLDKRLTIVTCTFIFYLVVQFIKGIIERL
jgi:predicted ABC-type exoprotein transport system permease subunit